MLVGSSVADDKDEIGQLLNEIDYIKSLLTKVGLDSCLSVFDNIDLTKSSSDRWSLKQLCSVMEPLLTARLKEQAFRADVEERVARLAHDLQDRTTQLVNMSSCSINCICFIDQAASKER